MKQKTLLLGLTAFLLVFIISLCSGVYYIPPEKVFLTLIGADSNHIYQTVILQIRLPRIIMDILVGAGLSAAGASYQALFKNPLVSPDILGVASGAAFGAALAILLNLNLYYIQIFAFLFGILSVILTLLLAKKGKEIPILGLIISGIVIGAFFTSLIGIIKYLADTQNQLPQIVFWMLGSFANVGWNNLSTMLVILFCILFLYMFRWQLNIASLTEEEAKSLGSNTLIMKIIIISLSTLVTSASVSIVGIIGWIGLISPHISRFITGADNTKVIPASMLFGSIFLMISDDFARSLTSGELPIGILTSLIGAPIFAYIYRKIYRTVS